jgi:hypothetical protein
LKTHYREIDCRVAWIGDLFTSLNHSFSIIQNKLNREDYYDGVFAQEQAETVFGIAFISAQTYITGTISDMKEIGGDQAPSIADMLALGSPVVGDLSKVEIINTIANYFKHHEQWEDWEEEGHKKRTIRALNSYGINENTLFPCHEAAQLVWPSEVLCELNEMLSVLVEWRKKLLQHVKKTCRE